MAPVGHGGFVHPVRKGKCFGLNREKTRSSLLGVAGGYLVYLAYGLFRDRGQTDTAMSPAARILFIALFALAGVALMVYAVVLWLRSGKEENERDAHDDMNSLK